MTLLTPLLLLSKNLLLTSAGILGIGFLIGFHELGHFLFCKLFNIYTPSFSIGFGPRIFTKKIGSTEFALSAIPLGGYVEIAGSAEVGQGEQEHAYATDETSFAKKPYWQKLLVLFGGILFNLIFAYVTFIGMFMVGMPKSRILFPENASTTLTVIAKDSPAQKAGLQVGDRLIALDGTALDNSASKLLDALKDKPEQEVLFTIERSSEGSAATQLRIPVQLGEQSFLGEKRGYLGVDFDMHALKPFSFMDSVRRGIELTHAQIAQTFGAFVYIFSKRDVSGVGGPIMIISATMGGAAKGLKIFLLLLALISINLAVLNLIPLPILDGGQILFTSIEALIRRPLPTKIKEYIHIASWLGIMLLVLYLSTKDIMRIATPYLKSLFEYFGYK